MHERHSLSRRRSPLRASEPVRPSQDAAGGGRVRGARGDGDAARRCRTGRADVQIEEMLVTATRRSESVQDIPINIAAFDGDLLEKREIADLADLGRNVPGMYVVDQGKRTSNQIVVRGLNLDPITASEGIGNDGGEVVSTYVGDIPLYVDLTLTDMDRVEVLLGPQGTLYGAGTLGGAIRYIPHRPELDATSFEFRGSAFGLAESDDYGSSGGFTFNIAARRELRVCARTSTSTNTPGFIDAPFLVQRARRVGSRARFRRRRPPLRRTCIARTT